MGATFFGDSSRPLFGYYHPPRGPQSRSVGVLLCGPAPQEYMRTHWAFRKLADLLARAGFGVLRFDYYGTGDSAGHGKESSLEVWRGNVATAAQELRDLSLAPHVSAVGFRLGAALAATSGVRLRDLVLWEPLVSGQRYMAHLETIRAHYYRLNPRPAQPLHVRGEELLGFPMPRQHEAEVRAVDLHNVSRPQAERISVMVSEPDRSLQALVSAWSTGGAAPTVTEVQEGEGGGRKDDVQAALLSNVMLNAIVARLT